jgi:superfamily I DNA/RNA helicase
MTDFQNTDEQDKIIDAKLTGKHVVIEAGAGCGKTTTLKQIARAALKREQLGYIAYNKAIATDAKASFPQNTTCATAHSFAFRAVGHKYKDRFSGPFVTNKQAAYILNINSAISWGEEAYYAPPKLARLALDTVKRFCYSADTDITFRNVPWIPGSEAYFDELATAVVPYARKAWADLIETSGRLRFEHDVYLKLWALSNPTLPFDVVMLDEAQDANPCIEGVVKNQDAQIIMVGDSAQQIYAWRGAQDALSRFHADHRLTLSQSFRFGPAIAEEANKWLELLNAPLRLKGFDKIHSVITELDKPDATLCRTNAQVVASALYAQEADHKVAIVGGTAEIRAFADAAHDLKTGMGTTHPDLMGFKSWADVQEYVNDEGGDLKVFVNLIDEYGVQMVKQIADKAVEEKYADVIISTAHKAKGREWKSVKIATDFREPVNEDGTPSEPVKAENMLAYVSVTRAMEQLDRGGLAWVDRYLGERPDEEPIQRAIRKKRAQRMVNTDDKE